MFKIGDSKELPKIQDHLSNEGKYLVRKCLQRNPRDRPSASELLDHPFVKGTAPLERPIMVPETSDPISGITHGTKALVRNLFSTPIVGNSLQLCLCGCSCYHLMVLCLSFYANIKLSHCLIYIIEQNRGHFALFINMSCELSVLVFTFLMVE